jgi:cysteine desulfuration protein SufE
MSLMDELAALPGSQARYDFLVARARAAAPLPPELRSDEFAIEGCMARLWIVPEFRAGRCAFRCDSDSVIVRAVAGLLCELADGKTPNEVLSLDPAALKPLGIADHLSANRRNALTRVWKTIRSFAEGISTTNE